LFVAVSLLDRAGEGAAFVPEQLTLDHAFGQRGAVDLDEGTVRTGAVVVDRLGDELLAGAGLTRDQDARVAARDRGDLVVDLLHLVGVADDVRGPEAVAELGAQTLVLLLELLPLLLRGAAEFHRLGDQGARDQKQTDVVVQVVVGLVGPVDAQRAVCLVAGADGHAEKGDLRALAAPRAVEEGLGLAGLRDHPGLARLDHLAGHALAEAVAGFRDLLDTQSVGDLDPDLAGLPVEQRDRAVLQVQVLGQGLERRPCDVAQFEALAKGLAQPVEELEFPGFA